MRTVLLALLSATLALAAATPLPALASQADPASLHHRGHVVVALAGGPPGGLRPGDAYDGGQVVRVDPAARLVVLDHPDTASAKRDLPSHAGVRWVEDDEPQPMLQDVTPNDPSFGSQYAPQLIRAPAAWALGTGRSQASVCIVDTGIRYTHQDLAAGYAGGWNVFTGTAFPWDDNGHGTHVAGIAAARIGNGLNIAGLADVPIYSYKALDNMGTGSVSTVASGITWCADHAGARTVINLSLGMTGYSATIANAVNYAVGKGALVVAAAGNDGSAVNYPAALSNVMAVTCTDSLDQQCSFSSRGPEAEIAAPGLGILSTWYSSNSGTAVLSGTSMSTPHVAGAAALYWSQHTTATAADVRVRLDATAVDLGIAGRDDDFGYGRLDLACLQSDALCPTSAVLPPLPTPSTPPATCLNPGPDAGGYVCAPIAGAFTDIAGTGIRVPLGDDQVSPAIPLPFAVPFYGMTASSVYVSSNGWIAFASTTQSGCCTGRGFPMTTLPNALVAGYWDNLDPRAGGAIQRQTLGVAPARTFVVQWTAVPVAAGGTATFQIVLHEDTSAIDVQFYDAPSDAARSTGIENWGGTSGLAYRVGAGADAGTGVRFLHPQADLSLAAGRTPAFPLTGQPATLSWTISNAGPDDLPGATLRATLASTLTTPLPLPAGCARASTTLTCSLGALPSGDSLQLNLTVVPTSTTPLSVPASVSGTYGDPDASDNSATLAFSATLSKADLASAVVVDTPSLLAGHVATATASVTNLGPQATAATTLRTTLPTGASLTSLPGGCSRVGTKVTCALGPIAAGSHVDVAFPILPTVAGHPTLTFSASSALSDPNTLNNVAATSLTVTQPAADVGITLTTPAPPAVGDVPTYTLTLTNHGPQDAPATKVTASLPSLIQWDPSGLPAGCAVTTSLACNLGTFPSGSTLAIDLTGTVVTYGSATLVARATSTALDLVLNNSASASVVVARPTASLSVAATAPLGGFHLATPTQVHVVLTNAGPAAAGATRLVANLPSVVAWSAAGLPSGCSLSSTTLSCNLGPLAVGTLAFDLQGTPTRLGMATMTWRATTTSLDPTTSDNASAIAVTVVA